MNQTLPTIVDNKKNFGTSPLGLFSFSLTTIRLMLIETKIVTGDFIGQVVGLAIFYGGIVQIIAGLFEFTQKNNFTGIVFSSYGAFWLSFSFVNYMNKVGTYTAMDKRGESIYLGTWGLFTLLMLSLTREKPIIAKFTFTSLAVAFGFLSGGVYNETVKQIGGYCGLISGISAGYLGYTELYLEMYNHKLYGI
jgi:succinate-acetate transporter protein